MSDSLIQGRKEYGWVEKTFMASSAVGLILIGVGVIIIALDAKEIPVVQTEESIAFETSVADSAAIHAAVTMREVRAC